MVPGIALMVWASTPRCLFQILELFRILVTTGPAPLPLSDQEGKVSENSPVSTHVLSLVSLAAVPPLANKQATVYFYFDLTLLPFTSVTSFTDFFTPFPRLPLSHCNLEMLCACLQGKQ
jgi:hypothetical protein